MSIAARPATSRTYFRGWRFGCLAASVTLSVFRVAAVGAAVLIFLFFAEPPPRLPNFGRPPSADLLYEVGGCGGTGDQPPCHLYEYGSNAEFSMASTALKAEYARQGWAIMRDDVDALETRSPGKDICVFYVRTFNVANDPPYDVEYRKVRSQYKILISVYVDNCPSNPG